MSWTPKKAPELWQIWVYIQDLSGQKFQCSTQGNWASYQSTSPSALKDFNFCKTQVRENASMYCRITHESDSHTWTSSKHISCWIKVQQYYLTWTNCCGVSKLVDPRITSRFSCNASLCTVRSFKSTPNRKLWNKQPPEIENKKGTLFWCDVKKGLFASIWPCF